MRGDRRSRPVGINSVGQQFGHGVDVALAGGIGGDRREFGGDARQGQIRAPAAERTGRFIADAGHQREFELVRQPNAEPRAGGIFDAGQRLMERHHPMRLQAMDQMTQRLGFRFGAGAPAGGEPDVAHRRRAVPAVDGIAGAPVGGREVAVQIDAVGIGAQPQLTAVGVDRQHHVMTQLLGGDAAQRAGQGYDGGALIAVGAGDDQPGFRAADRRREIEQRRAQQRAAVVLSCDGQLATFTARSMFGHGVVPELKAESHCHFIQCITL